MSKALDKAQQKLSRADRFLKNSLVFFGFFVVITFGFVAYQLYHLQNTIGKQQLAELKHQEEQRLESRTSLRKALDETNRQHVVTQQYIRCIAQVLLKPLAERSVDDLEKCGIPNVANTSHSPDAASEVFTIRVPAMQYQPRTQQTPATMAHPTQPPVPEEPTTGNPPPPPDPEGEQPRGIYSIPIIGRLLKTLGL